MVIDSLAPMDLKGTDVRLRRLGSSLIMSILDTNVCLSFRKSLENFYMLAVGYRHTMPVYAVKHRRRLQRYLRIKLRYLSQMISVG